MILFGDQKVIVILVIALVGTARGRHKGPDPRIFQIQSQPQNFNQIQRNPNILGIQKYSYQNRRRKEANPLKTRNLGLGLGSPCRPLGTAISSPTNHIGIAKRGNKLSSKNLFKNTYLHPQAVDIRHFI